MLHFFHPQSKVAHTLREPQNKNITIFYEKIPQSKNVALLTFRPQSEYFLSFAKKFHCCARRSPLTLCSSTALAALLIWYKIHKGKKNNLPFWHEIIKLSQCRRFAVNFILYSYFWRQTNTKTTTQSKRVQGMRKIFPKRDLNIEQFTYFVAANTRRMRNVCCAVWFIYAVTAYWFALRNAAHILCSAHAVCQTLMRLNILPLRLQNWQTNLRGKQIAAHSSDASLRLTGAGLGPRQMARYRGHSRQHPARQAKQYELDGQIQIQHRRRIQISI